jgi:hypothetical protein
MDDDRKGAGSCLFTGTHSPRRSAPPSRTRIKSRAQRKMRMPRARVRGAQRGGITLVRARGPSRWPHATHEGRVTQDAAPWIVRASQPRQNVPFDVHHCVTPGSRPQHDRVPASRGKAPSSLGKRHSCTARAATLPLVVRPTAARSDEPAANSRWRAGVRPLRPMSPRQRGDRATLTVSKPNSILRLKIRATSFACAARANDSC